MQSRRDILRQIQSDYQWERYGVIDELRDIERLWFNVCRLRDFEETRPKGMDFWQSVDNDFSFFNIKYKADSYNELKRSLAVKRAKLEQELKRIKKILALLHKELSSLPKQKKPHR